MGMLEYDLPAGFEPPSITLPRHQTAIVQDAEGKAIIRHDVSLPVPEPHMVIVKTVAVSINPCDWKMPSRFPSPGARIGCDFSGTIVAIGPKVERLSRKLKLGDRVCGGVHGSNPIDLPSGSFAQYVAAHGDLLFKLPEHIRWESGAVLGASVISTLSIVLYKSLQLTATPDKPFSSGEARIPHVLVYGGSTSTGTMALQLLRLSGYKPITTCSPRNHELVRSFGAEAVFDYRSPTCAEDIRTYTSRSLSRVLDIITDARSQTVCGNAFGRAGGLYTVLELPNPESPLARRRTVKTEMVVGLAATGKEIALGDGYERSADPAIRTRAAHDFQVVQRLLDEKRLRPHPARVVRGGFEGVLDGLKTLRDMGTSGEKLVVFLDEAAEKLYFTESQV